MCGSGAAIGIAATITAYLRRIIHKAPLLAQDVYFAVAHGMTFQEIVMLLLATIVIQTIATMVMACVSLFKSQSTS